MAHETVHDLLARLLNEGFAVELAGERVRVAHPDREPSDDERAAIRTHRDALLALLTEEAWDAWERGIAETAANLTGATAAEKRGWHREVVAALRWVRDGQPASDQFQADLEHDREALRRLLGLRRCLDCGKAIVGGDWCERCEAKPYRPVEPGEGVAA